MKKSLFFAIFTAFFACTGADTLKLDAASLEQMLQKDNSVQLVDLRTPAELQQTGIIRGAQTINYNGPDFEAQIKKLDPGRPVVLYCAAGSRSARAQEDLKKWGFKTVYNYTGGMNDWKARNKPTIAK